MRYARVRNAARGRVLGTRVALADRWWLRMRGLLGRPPLRPGEGMMLTPCAAVHMYGMKHPLDVAFLAEDGAVLAVYHALPPGGRTRWHRGARHALELPPGTLAGTDTQEGDRLTWSAAVVEAA